MRERVASESLEQQWLMGWARMQEGAHPELQLLYHIPNEGQRSTRAGARMRSEGLKRGVPDLCLPVPRGGFNGLYIELKRRKWSRVSPEQRAWIDCLRKQGYRAEICYGWDEARELILEYLKNGE